MEEDFREIAHSGGKITFTVRTNEDGLRTFQVGIRSMRPVPVVMIGVYALPPGIPVGSLDLTSFSPAPPFPGCYPVMIQSDSHGLFGHHCPGCDGYWRSGPWPQLCPYCHFTADGFQFLSKAQRVFVRHYCGELANALATEGDVDVVIDMDEVADAVQKEAADRPAFFIAEESQQHKFNCGACDEVNDILGRFGYCSHCGTRNDLADFETKTIAGIREQVNGNGAPQNCVRDAVAAFDSFVAQYAKQLAEQVPLSKARVARLTKHSFHDLEEVRKVFDEWFDIDLVAGMKNVETSMVNRMFLRRHLYEHNGGEVDQKYLDKSGDTSVRLKQFIREDKAAVHSLLGSLVKMARNLHSGFHELVVVDEDPIRAFDEQRRRMSRG
jgi:hypothetical protein